VKIIKFGGSVITRKEKYRKLNRDAIENLCSAISSIKEPTILIHGAGSFGHLLALKYGLDTPGPIEGKEKEVSRVMADVLSLDSILVDELNRHGIKAVAVPPHVVYTSSKPDFKSVERIVESGFVPVLYGDIIFTDGRYRILSGDDIALDLSIKYRPDSVIFLTDVDGLFTLDPKKFPDAKLIRKIKAEEIVVNGPKGDATGSMAGKMEKIKKMVLYTKKVLIVNGLNQKTLENWIRGRKFVGTVIT
jgi:isopentenyl phosphate kinase